MADDPKNPAGDTPEDKSGSGPDKNKNVFPIRVEEEVKNSFLDYSMSVIISRALPDARDGLKPSQRRILYAMFHDLSLVPPKPYLKCARIVGDTMGKYHPHGDQAIYPTLVNMAQTWTMRDILIDGQGNFGSVEGDPPAAMRYTEARLTHLGATMMTDMDKGTVDYVPNYDEKGIEPTVLPAAFPNLLINGGTGIAVGMATNMPPHNLGEVIDAIFAQIDDPNITVRGLMQFVQGPDFPTGCTVLGVGGVRRYLETGRGSMRVRGTAEIVENGKREQIIVTEIPFNVNRATFVTRIADLVNTKVIPEISAVRDESDENTRVVIDLKREARSQVVLNNLYKHTQLESSYSSNMLAIDHRRPRLLNLKDAIGCYIEHRREVILRRTRFLLDKAEAEAEKLEAFLTAIGNLDEVIEIVRSSANKEVAFERLKAKEFTLDEAISYGINIRGQASVQGERYLLTDIQVNHILELRLYQLTGLEQDKIKDRYAGVLADIEDLLDILAKEERVLQIIKDELGIIRDRFATPRRTKIDATAIDDSNIDITDLIANEGNIITLTHRGFIKRTLAGEYRTQNRGGKGMKGMETREAATDDDEDDFVEHLFGAASHDYLMFFTNTGRVFVERVYAIPEGSRTAKGRSIKNLLNLRPDERIAATLRLERGLDEDGQDATFLQEDTNVFFATRSGKCKKTKLIDFKNYRKDGIIAIKLDEGNELVDVRLTSEGDDVCLVTSDGLCVRTDQANFRPMGRNSAGVRGIRPKEGDRLVAFVIPEEARTFMVVSENGLGKRTDFNEFMSKGRGGKGMKAMQITEKTGNVCAALSVAEEDDIMCMTSKGQSVRIPASSVRIIGRATQGVRIMKLKDGEILQDVARVIRDQDESDETEETGETDSEAPAEIDSTPEATDGAEEADES